MVASARILAPQVDVESLQASVATKLTVTLITYELCFLQAFALFLRVSVKHETSPTLEAIVTFVRLIHSRCISSICAIAAYQVPIV